MPAAMSEQAYAAFVEFCDSEGEALAAIDIVTLAHALLCLGLAKLPEYRQQAIIEGLNTSVPREVHRFIAAEQRDETLRVLN